MLFFVKKQERRPTFLGEADGMGIGGWVFFYVGKIAFRGIVCINTRKE
jgi:hypothetical protein